MNKNWKRSKRFIKYYNDFDIIDKEHLIISFDNSLFSFDDFCGSITRYKNLNLLDQEVLSLKKSIEKETEILDVQIFRALRAEYNSRIKALETDKYKDYMNQYAVEVDSLFMDFLSKNDLGDFLSIAFNDEIEEESKLRLLKDVFGESNIDVDLDSSDWLRDEFKTWKASKQKDIFVKNSCVLKEFLRVAIFSEILFSPPFLDVLDLHRRQIFSEALKWGQKPKNEINTFIENHQLFDENQELLAFFKFIHLVCEGKSKHLEMLNSFDQNLPKEPHKYFTGWDRKLDYKRLYKFLFDYLSSDLKQITLSRVKSLPPEIAVANSLFGIENTISAKNSHQSEKLKFLFGLFEICGIIKGVEFEFEKESRETFKKEFNSFCKSNAAKIMMLQYRV